MLDIQKKIYEHIMQEGRVTREQVIKHLSIPDWEIEKHIAVLRHCELVKGKKAEEIVFLVLFDQ